MNKAILIGNLTKDPELAKTQSNISVCSFTIAVNRSYSNADGKRDADFINIVAWRALADNCDKYLNKGSKVAICGQIQTRSYEGKDGTKRFVTEVIAEDVEFLGGNKNEASEPTAPAKKVHVEQDKIELNKLKPTDDDSLPF